MLPGASKCGADSGGYLDGDMDDPDGSCASPLASCDLIVALNSWLDQEVAVRVRNTDKRLEHLVLLSRQILACQQNCSTSCDQGDQPILLNSRFTMLPFYEDGHGLAVNKDPDAFTHFGSEASHAPKRSVSSASKSSRNSLSIFHVSTKEQKLEAIRERILTYQQFRGKHAAAMWRFFENRYSGRLAYLYAMFIPWFVACSVVFSFWETVDGCPLKGALGEVLQSCFESVFALELLLRCLVCPDRWQFWRDPFNYIDLLSALPMVFRITFGMIYLFSGSADATGLLSSIAVMPVLRLLKLMRRFEKFQLLLSAFIIAIEALPVLLYSLIVIALLFSALIYFVEPDESIDSLPRALWFILVTMTTVGYGDVTPSTTLGHAVIILLMIISSLYMAMPIGIVGNAFSQAWMARDRLLLMHRMREAFLQQGFSAKALENIVKMFDGDHDGELGMDEFVEMLEAMHIHITHERVLMLLDSLDTDGSGKISVDELMTGLFPQDYAQLFANMSRATSNFGVRHSYASQDTVNSGNWTSHVVKNFIEQGSVPESGNFSGISTSPTRAVSWPSQAKEKSQRSLARDNSSTSRDITSDESMYCEARTSVTVTL